MAAGLFVQPTYLLQNVNANTVGTGVALAYTSRSANVIVSGTLGGGTVTLQVSLDNINWASLANEEGTIIPITAPIGFPLTNLAPGQFIRASLAGAGGASGVNVALLWI